MNALTFWFYFVLFGSGCGFVSVIVLITKAVRNRPKRKMISSVGMTWDDFEKELSYKQITKGITAERLSEICAAEREGRCVIQRECQLNLIDEETSAWECSNCGHTVQLDDGNPFENDINFCPKCGDPIALISWDENSWDDYTITRSLLKEDYTAMLAEMKGE